MTRILLVLTISALIASCKTGIRTKNLHEEYGKKLIEAGLDQTVLGRRWFSAAEAALKQPQTVSLPYKEVGYFAENKPRAAGLRFEVKTGQKLHIELITNPASGFIVFTDLWDINQGNFTLLVSADTSKTFLDYEAEKNGYLLLRLQPELLRSGDYALSISISPSLSFPVSSNSARVESFWGDSRDNGGRRHEGIDIFAPRGTPVIAAANGTVVSVTENKLGGKVIFFRPKNKNFSLYYAHLDSQLVSEGIRLKTGDTIGFVGNTGNARTSPPHLHFGIYTAIGAIDPFPFVDPEIKKPPEVNILPGDLENGFRLNQNLVLRSSGGERAMLYKEGTPVWPFSKSANEYWVELPDGMISSAKQNQVSIMDKPRKTGSARKKTIIYESADTTSPKMMILEPGTRLSLLANFNKFYYVRTGNGPGWIKESDLE